MPSATRIWRLCNAKVAAHPLEDGDCLDGGRWSAPGIPIIYTSSTLPLAELEMLVHLDDHEPPRGLVAVELEVPARVLVESLDRGELPRSWRRDPPPAALRRIGTEWARSRRSALLRVPSAVVPREVNYLVNPEHPDAHRLEVLGREPVAFDARLFRRK